MLVNIHVRADDHRLPVNQPVDGWFVIKIGVFCHSRNLPCGNPNIRGFLE